MKTIQTNKFRNSQKFNGIIAPMFLPIKLEQPMVNNATTQDTEQAELSVFDVKELYDTAYDAKAAGNELKFKSVLIEAVKLDMAYRRQLASAASYKDHQKQQSFKEASSSEPLRVNARAE